MAKKLKKLLKKVGKAALIGGALYGATRLGRGAKGNVSKTAAMEDIITRHRPDDYNYRPKKVVENFDPNFLLPGSKDGGRIGAKKGGRVTGAAKRGFGRALMKGKK